MITILIKTEYLVLIVLCFKKSINNPIKIKISNYKHYMHLNTINIYFPCYIQFHINIQLIIVCMIYLYYYLNFIKKCFKKNSKQESTI